MIGKTVQVSGFVDVRIYSEAVCFNSLSIRRGARQYNYRNTPRARVLADVLQYLEPVHIGNCKSSRMVFERP